MRWTLPLVSLLVLHCGDDGDPSATALDGGSGGRSANTGGSGAASTGGASGAGNTSAGGAATSGGAPATNGGTAGRGTGGSDVDGGDEPADGGEPDDGGPRDASRDGGAVDAEAGGRSRDGGSLTDAELDGAAGEGGASGCSGAADRVCVDYPGTFAVFLDAAGTVIHSGIAPIDYPVEGGGSVLAQTAVGLAWVLDVPAGLTLREADVVVPPPPRKFQDIRLNVPAPPVAGTPLSWAGCRTTGGARFGVGTGEVVFDMNETCLKDGKATVYVQTGGSFYLLVTDIALGADSEPPLDVPLGAWQTPSGPGPTLTVTNIPSGFVGQVTFRARYGEVGELSGGTRGLVIAGGTATIDMPPLIGVGEEWSRFLQIGEGSVNGSRSAIANEPLGPTPGDQDVDFDADLLPLLVNITASGNGLSWSYSSQAPLADADWLRFTVSGTGPSGADNLQVIAPPQTTSVTLPASLPGEYSGKALSSITRATFAVEDYADADGYADRLGNGRPRLQYPGLITDPLGRQTVTNWQP